MKMVSNDDEADEMTMRTAARLCAKEIDEVVKKYARIIPARLAERFQDMIYEIQPAANTEWFAKHLVVPDTVGDKSYEAAVEFLVNVFSHSD